MRRTISIAKEFFCDGHCYLLTSASLGGSGLTARDIENTWLEQDSERAVELLKKGVCFPVCFEGDCALDRGTLFVVGDLTAEEEKNWIARLGWKLNIPCGKLILCCGCLEEDLEPAVEGIPARENFMIYQTIDVPPDEYLVEIYAYLSSMTVQCSLDTWDEKGNYTENEELEKWYRENRPGGGRGYIIRLSPLESEPPLPETEGGWFQKFEFRQAPEFQS